MKSKFFISAIAGLCAVASLLSCGSDSSSNSEAPAKPKKEKTSKPKPLSVSIYLDNSSSMKGYYAPSSGNSAEINDILAAIKTKYQGDPIHAFYTQKGPKGTDIKEYSYDDITAQLSTKKIGYTDAYQLDQFVKTIYKQTKADASHSTINFFVTDGILSGTDAEISSNPEYNKVSRSHLRNRIAEELMPFAKMNYSVALFQFNVNFGGTYYNYRNAKTQITGKRPIYVLAIGPNEQISEFEQLAMAGSLRDFNPAHSLLITNSSSTITPNVSNCKRNGKIYTAMPKASMVKGSKAQLRVSVPVDKLPSYMADEEALRKAVILKINGKTVPAESIKINSGKVTIPVEIKYGKNTFTLQIKNTLPGWIAKASADDDSNIKGMMSQTFNLSTFVDGLCQGMSESSSNDVMAPKEYTIDWDGESE